MVDGFVLTVGDLVIVEVDLVEDGLVEVASGVVGGAVVRRGGPRGIGRGRCGVCLGRFVGGGVGVRRLFCRF